MSVFDGLKAPSYFFIIIFTIKRALKGMALMFTRPLIAWSFEENQRKFFGRSGLIFCREGRFPRSKTCAKGFLAD